MTGVVAGVGLVAGLMEGGVGWYIAKLSDKRGVGA
jgi:hypothetical protein